MNSSNGYDATRINSTFSKRFRIFEALASAGCGRGVSELARELEMTQSNEFRLLQTLTRLDYVRRGKDRIYSATFQAWRVGWPLRTQALGA